ncbi:MAG: Rieske (2Fe-2S) protein [Nevskiaceae bacterium]|nr:MAG: Rieske (2Fe-2S) protein [Nevskiaceae bacterium]TBR74787.1 MAG: Rieske (2Fe-2S) protein [Nevskiaceae bacterium]
MDRRHFVKLCAGSALATLLARQTPAFSGEIKTFPAATLVDAHGDPLKASRASPQEAMVFAYPFAGIPCFLINFGSHGAKTQALTAPDGTSYTSPAPVGPERNLVAFVAICTHQMSHPTPDASVIHYASAATATADQPGRIVCCAHHSVFDPASGGAKVSGPAPSPLLPVQLACDAETGVLQATGTVDVEFFERFFDDFKEDLIDRFGPGGYRKPVGGMTKAVLLSEYSRVVADC